MKKLFAYGISILTLTAGAATTEVLLNDNAENGGANWKTVKVTTQDKFEGKSAFEQGSRTVVSTKRFKVDPQATYVLNCAVKATGAAKGSYFIGFGCFDKTGRAIGSQEVFWLAGTETTLAKAAYLGDQELIVKNGAAWKPLRYGMVAFNIDPSGQQKDLPNRNLSALGIAKVEKMGENWKITLNKPLKKDYPAGTAIREHQLWSARNFVWSQGQLPTNWKKVGGRCTGVAKRGNARPGQWWPGTESFEVVLLFNIPDKKPMLFDAVKLEKITK